MKLFIIETVHKLSMTRNHYCLYIVAADDVHAAQARLFESNVVNEHEEINYAKEADPETDDGLVAFLTYTKEPVDLNVL